jgi:hypothetical protein
MAKVASWRSVVPPCGITPRLFLGMMATARKHDHCYSTYFTNVKPFSSVQAAEFEKHKLCATLLPRAAGAHAVRRETTP